MSKQWKCDNCGNVFKTKKKLIEHLKDELDRYNEDVSYIEGCLQDLGIENPYD